MSFDKDLKKALAKYAPNRVVYVQGWTTRNTGKWRVQGSKSRNLKAPLMVMEHHTAGAATESVSPKNPGNKKGANNGVVQYCVASHNSVPYCNAVVDRDGTIYVLAAYPVWHAGVGDFAGTRWARFGIGANTANTCTFGVEIVSKGRKQDFTAAQKLAIRRLNCAVREASGWKGFKFRIANHKDWAGRRKVDTKYPWEFFVKQAVKAWRNFH